MNFFMILLALMAGALIGYGFYAAGAGRTVTIAGSVLCTLFLASGLGISVEGYPRASALAKVVSMMTFLGLLVLNVVFAWVGVGDAACIITNGLLTLISAGSIYLIVRSRV